MLIVWGSFNHDKKVFSWYFTECNIYFSTSFHKLLFLRHLLYSLIEKIKFFKFQFCLTRCIIQQQRVFFYHLVHYLGISLSFNLSILKIQRELLSCTRFRVNPHSTAAWVCVCVCLRANHLDVVRLGVKVDQGLPCVRHYIPRSSGKSL